MSEQSDRWCILRTSGGNTLPVTRSLREAGYDVWTPVEVQKRRAPRSKITKEIALPITPGIIFARDDRLLDLMALARSPALTYLAWNPERKRMERHGCPPFSIFRHEGRHPLIYDRHLDPLRQAEQRGRPRSQLPVLKAGDAVRHPAGMFGGLTGTVQHVMRRKAKVTFGALEIEIETCDLLPVNPALDGNVPSPLNTAHPERGQLP